MADPDLRAHWKDRLDAVGRAQARYLWILLVAGIFFWGVDQTLFAPGPAIPSTVQAPLLGLDISAVGVWAAGPAVLFLLLLVILGSMRAVKVARSALKIGDLGTDAEAFDSTPNAIDLAAYSTADTPRGIRWLLGTSYPTFLSVFYAQGIYHLAFLWGLGTLERWAYLLAGLTSLLAVWCGIRLVQFWWSRLKGFRRAFTKV